MSSDGITLTLIRGDCLKVLPTFPENMVDLVVADPPYYVLENVKRVSEDAREWDSFSGPEEFVDFSRRWLRECFRVSCDGASCFVFWSEKNLFLFPKVLDGTGWKFHKILVWHYPNILKAFSNTRWHNTFDFIFHLVKGSSPKTFTAKFTGGENVDVLTYPKPQHNFRVDKKLHTAQKPLELVKHLVKMFSSRGSIVLDPFLGSGTTMLACRMLWRNCIGIELNEKYVEIVKERVHWGSSLEGVRFQYVDIV
jgi:site-specific DNA-methyltransferase (adenine-specific)